MLSVGKQNHYTNCRSQRGANKHTQSHSSCLNARLAQKQPEDKAYGLRKYPSNLIRITPAKGFEALSKSFATPFSEVQSVEKITPPAGAGRRARFCQTAAHRLYLRLVLRRLGPGPGG